MKKIIFTFLISTFLINAQAETYRAKDFSDDYYALIKVTENDYSVTVFDKKTDRIVIKQVPELLTYPDLDENNQIIVNITEFPYGAHSPITYDDFNFDGIKDFAIQNRRYGCYGGYTIYLAYKKGFKESREFSELTEGYCGMFEYDPNKKEIYTMSKTGAAWHSYETYDVINNKPRLIKFYIVDGFATEQTDRDYGGVKIIESILNIKTQKMDEREYIAILDDYFIQRLFSFSIAESKKQVIFFKSPKTDKLAYAFLKENDEVEIVHDSGDENRSDFTYEKNGDTEYVYFSNPSVKYTIYKTSNSIGLKVLTNGKNYDFMGDFNSIKGDLKSLFL